MPFWLHTSKELDNCPFHMIGDDQHWRERIMFMLERAKKKRERMAEVLRNREGIPIVFGEEL